MSGYFRHVFFLFQNKTPYYYHHYGENTPKLRVCGEIVMYFM